MNKFFIAMGVVALSFATIACGNTTAQSGDTPKAVRNINLKKYKVKRGAEMDTLSYAIGTNLGLQLRFGMTDLELDNELYLKYVIEFFENGSLEDERLMEDQQSSMEFHYTRYMPYAQALRQREMFKTDRPDTLPLPEIFDDNFTKERVTGIFGRSGGAMLINLKDDIDIKWVMDAIDDCLALESEEAFADGLKLNEEQIRNSFIQYQIKRQQRDREERERKLTENKEASAKWLAEVEQLENVYKTESGLLYRIDREGTGAYATLDTDVVEVHYEGKTRDGEIFDSSYKRNESISFGLNQVIKGWTEGMKLVSEGGQITLWIPSELAYGDNGSGQAIGPGEALEFKVELFKVNPQK